MGVRQKFASLHPERELASLSIVNRNNAGDLSLLGISVEWLQTGFLAEVDAAGHDASEAKVYDIEDLRKVNEPGLIRRKGEHVQCPITNQPGAAYVHCLQGEDQVGDATHMLSYTWG